MSILLTFMSFALAFVGAFLNFLLCFSQFQYPVIGLVTLIVAGLNALLIVLGAKKEAIIHENMKVAFWGDLVCNVLPLLFVLVIAFSDLDGLFENIPVIIFLIVSGVVCMVGPVVGLIITSRMENI